MKRDTLFWWSLVLVSLVSLSIIAYILTICIKLDKRSGFDYAIIGELLLLSHSAAVFFFILVLSSKENAPQQKIASIFGLILTIGSFCSQLLFVIKMDTLITNISWSITSIPFVISLAIVGIFSVFLNTDWCLLNTKNKIKK